MILVARHRLSKRTMPKPNYLKAARTDDDGRGGKLKMKCRIKI